MWKRGGEAAVIACWWLCLCVVPVVWADNPVNPRHCGGRIRHVHLAVGRDPSTEMTVSFASVPGTNTAPIGGVLVGTSPQSLTTAHLETEPAIRYHVSGTGKQSNYGDDDYYSPTYHHITVSGLEPSTTYYYKPVVHSHLTSFEGYTIVRALDPETDVEQVVQEELETDPHSVVGGGGDDDKAADDDYKDIGEENNERQLLAAGHGRLLERLAPYDGTKVDCPSPEKIRSFRTAPRPPTPGDESSYTAVQFAMVGDLGQFPHSQETCARLLRSLHRTSGGGGGASTYTSNVDVVDAIVLAGDIAYANMDHRQWDTFFDFMDDYPIAQGTPMQIVPGNHDIDKLANGDEIFLAYEHRFRMPRVRAPQLGRYTGPPGELNMDQPPYPLPYEWGNAYYAYSYGPVHFVMISSYSSVEPDSVQYQWLVQEFKNVNRAITPWLVVVLHTPLYNTFSLHRKDLQIEACKRNLEPLFVQHGVNMVFSGHIHAYLRTTNVINDGELHPKGPIHITVGAGGRKCEAPFMNEEPEPWVQVRDATLFGYGMFRVWNRTHAEWEWIHTGKSDTHSGNQIRQSDATLPPGPATDRITIENQFFL
jgi:acid phosphatase type 7